MIKLFRSSNQLTILVLLIYLVITKAYYLLNPSMYQSDGSEGLAYHVWVTWMDSVIGPYPLFYTGLAIALLFIQALILNHIIINHRLYPKDHYLPAMCFLLFTSLLESWNVFSPALIVNTIMLWIFNNIIHLYLRPSARDLSFNMGLALGIGGLFYFPTILLGALILISLLIMRPFRLAEWLVALLGLICPFYLISCYLFVTDQWDLIVRLPNIGINWPEMLHYKAWGAAVISLLFFVVGWILLLQRNFKKMLIRNRKIWLAAVVYVLVAMLVPFFSEFYSPEYWVLAILPISLIASNVFWNIKNNKIANVLHFMILAYVIIMQYFSHA